MTLIFLAPQLNIVALSVCFLLFVFKYVFRFIKAVLTCLPHVYRHVNSIVLRSCSVCLQCIVFFWNKRS